MAHSSRDRISVDLQGLKAPLCERARLAGVLPSTWVRAVLADALEQPGGSGVDTAWRAIPRRDASRVRLSLRMTRAQALTVTEAARRTGMHPGDYVASLAAGVPLAASGYRRADHVAALSASCAELSTFSRTLHQLSLLLRNGSFRAAQEYQAMLDRLDASVKSHLKLTSTALSELRPDASSGAGSKNAHRKKRG